MKSPRLKRRISSRVVFYAKSTNIKGCENEMEIVHIVLILLIAYFLIWITLLILFENVDYNDLPFFLEYRVISSFHPKRYTRIVFFDSDGKKRRGRVTNFGQIVAKKEVIDFSDIIKWKYSFMTLFVPSNS